MKYAGCCLLLLSFAGVASAADSDVQPPMGSYWSGVYIGGNVGYGGGKTGNSWTNTMFYPAWLPDGDVGFRSWLGGAHAGVMYQSGNFVFGMEADYNWMRFRGDDSASAGVVNAVEIDSYATARARLGWAHDRSLVYVTGGVSYAQITKKDLSATMDSTLSKAIGWVAGAGYERALTDNWLARIEYSHVDLGEAETFLQSVGGGYSHRSNGIRFDTIRVGVSYKF